jgi:hypothetical protein
MRLPTILSVVLTSLFQRFGQIARLKNPQIGSSRCSLHNVGPQDLIFKSEITRNNEKFHNKTVLSWIWLRVVW